MNTERYLPLAGRVLIGLPFLLFGLGKAAAYEPTVGMIEAAGVPLAPLAFLGTVTLEVLGGALLLAGFKVRPVAVLLAAFSVIAAFVFHGNVADQAHFVHFFKNLMMAGGLLQITAFGAGAFSLDRYLERRRANAGRFAAAY